MLAGYGAAVMLILMSRSPAIEHGVGSDRLARWHSRMGPAIIVLAVVHALAALQSWAGVRGVGLIAATHEVLGWPGLFAAALGLVLLVVVGLGSLRWVRRQMPYEHWHVFHLVTYVAVALGFTHQLAGPNLVGNRAVQIGWSLLYAYAFAMVVRYRLVQPLHQLWRHRLKVERDRPRVRRRGQHPDVRCAPGRLQAEAGQFFRWRFLTRSTWSASYPFSLSAPPTNDRLRITIKALGLASGRCTTCTRHDGAGRGPVRGADRGAGAGRGCCWSPVASASLRCGCCSRRWTCPARTSPCSTGSPTRRRPCSGRSWTPSPPARAPG